MKINCNKIVIFFIVLFILYLIYTQYLDESESKDPVLHHVINKVRPIFNQNKYYEGYLSPMNGKNILKHIRFYEDDKSYTINKHKVYMCLKDENGKYYDENMLIYVLLHELAHVICDEVGHTPKFNKIFDELLNEAIKLNIYDPSKPLIRDYCLH